MFRILRAIDQHNPAAYRDLIELTDRLEQAGIFSGTVDLDAGDSYVTFARRRGQWEFNWSFRATNPKFDRQDTIGLFVGKAGSYIFLARPYPAGPNKSPSFGLVTEIDTVYADKVFKDLATAYMDTLETHSAWLSAARYLAEFFLKQPT